MGSPSCEYCETRPPTHTQYIIPPVYYFHVIHAQHCLTLWEYSHLSDSLLSWNLVLVGSGKVHITLPWIIPPMTFTRQW